MVFKEELEREIVSNGYLGAVLETGFGKVVCGSVERVEVVAVELQVFLAERGVEFTSYIIGA